MYLSTCSNLLQDLEPDVVTYTTLMKALVRVDKFHKVHKHSPYYTFSFQFCLSSKNIALIFNFLCVCVCTYIIAVPMVSHTVNLSMKLADFKVSLI